MEAGYNNVLKLATSGMKFGKNDDVNYFESERVSEEPKSVSEEPKRVSEEPESVSEEPKSVSKEPKRARK